MYSRSKPGLRLIPALILLLMVHGATAARAQQAGQVKSVLQAFRVVVDKGVETFAEASRAKAGETLEYRLTYENGTAGEIRNLLATLPIPKGTAYLERSARPGQVQASLDGKAFQPVPLTRDQKLPGGKTVRAAVPASEYRFLRWTVPALKAGASTTLVARVRILGPAAR